MSLGDGVTGDKGGEPHECCSAQSSFRNGCCDSDQQSNRSSKGSVRRRIYTARDWFRGRRSGAPDEVAIRDANAAKSTMAQSSLSAPMTKKHGRDHQRKFCRGSAVANVAIARKLAAQLYWKLRKQSRAVPPGSPINPVVGHKPIELWSEGPVERGRLSLAV